MPTFRIVHPEEVTKFLQEGYTFRQPKRFRWLGSLLRRLWMKFAEPNMVRSTKYKHVSITDESIQNLIQQSSFDLDIIWEKRAKHIVVGWSEFNSLLGELINTPGHALSFDMDIPIGRGREYRVFGMEVHVVPWFDGILLLPDWYDLR